MVPALAATRDGADRPERSRLGDWYEFAVVVGLLTFLLTMASVCWGIYAVAFMLERRFGVRFSRDSDDPRTFDFTK